MKAEELRRLYIEFFKTRGHKEIPSASLIPENDPTVLFTTAGMHPLVPYLTGQQKHPMGNRLVNCQKCIRTQDIEEVGDESHTTFFEMLGNWSLGDYFKEEAIKMSWEFLTDEKWLALDKNKIAISIFKGDGDAPFDKESKDIWIRVGVCEDRIAALPKDKNWWGPAGNVGPCGPDTEMFFYVGSEEEPPPQSNPETDELNWLEIWNDVFMEYGKTSAGKYEPLKQKNVDTGLGLERVACVLQGKTDIYTIELFEPIIKKLEGLTGKSYETQDCKKSFRIIADHIRAATFILGDDKAIVPSNVDQGYVLRKYIRRIIRHGRIMGVNKKFCSELAEVVIGVMKDPWKELEKNKLFILSELSAEEDRFNKTITQGLKEFDKTVKGYEKAFEATGKKISIISGKHAFKLYDTYGFPLEMTDELAEEKGLEVDHKGFNKCFQEHQKKSRIGAEKKFKGGLEDDSEKVIRFHTATHLLHQALRIILGKHVQQRGSNITSERLRFDFSHPDKLSDMQIKKVEELVNTAIEKGMDVKRKEMTPAEAAKQEAIGLFGDRYGEKVTVYSIGDFSKEICAGPHVSNTKELGRFKITKEQSSSAGIRRIRAVLEGL
ncbi:MAG: alanine--tRNA ligase [Candidatus Aureabacteria bacterium]|nr:alanine--tRNA ligase [Candidatus Auribacterota bacterium]